jgi:enoyl-CoA hydratase
LNSGLSDGSEREAPSIPPSSLPLVGNPSVGDLDLDDAHTPGIYVQKIVKVPRIAFDIVNHNSEVHTLGYHKTDFVAFVEVRGVRKGTSLPQLAADLVDLCSEIAWDDGVRVVVLEYDGNIGRSVGEGIGSFRADASSMVETVGRIKQPVIAAIRGDVIGLGLELAMACDLRIGIEGARLGLPQILDGAVPFAGGTQRLPRLVGQGKALELVLTGSLVGAAEALRIGLLNRVFPADQLADQVEAIAREMAEKSPLAMSYVKEALHSGLDLTLDQGLRAELDLYLLLFTTIDRAEGVTAFKERRKPKFTGE